MAKKLVRQLEYVIDENELRTLLQSITDEEIPKSLYFVSIDAHDDIWAGPGDEDDASEKQLLDEKNWTREWLLTIKV